MQSPYDILGLDAHATAAEVKKAFRRLARRHHPDHNPGDPDAARRFREIREAFAILGDPDRRARFDRCGGQRGGFEGAAFCVDDLLGELFGRRHAPPSDVVELVLELRQAARGGSFEVVVSGEARTVQVPAGTSDGDVLPLHDGGVVSVQVRRHPVFRREGADLHVDVPVTIGEALRGGAVPVPTLDGRVRVRVPGGTQCGAVLRLRGKGIGGGDLYAHLLVRLPTTVDPDTVDDALQQLEQAYEGDVRADLLAACE